MESQLCALVEQRLALRDALTNLAEELQVSSVSIIVDTYSFWPLDGRESKAKKSETANEVQDLEHTTPRCSSDAELSQFEGSDNSDQRWRSNEVEILQERASSDKSAMVDEDTGTPQEQERNGAEGAAGEFEGFVDPDQGWRSNEAEILQERASSDKSAMVDEDAGTPLEQERNGAEGAAGEVYEDVGADVGPYCRDAALRREYRQSTSMSAETSIASSAEDFPMADDGSSDGSSRMSTASYRQPEYALYTQLPPFPGTCPKALLGSVRYIYKDIDQFYSQALAAWFEYQDRERWSTQKIGFSVLHRPAVLSAWMKNKRPDKPAAQLVRNAIFVREVGECVGGICIWFAYCGGGCARTLATQNGSNMLKK
ncbi:hypothetical protein EV122DRAFT_253368 [Schizophyllum commune]